ncbi:MAG: oxidoreductase, partial [Planctomycetota bacterium]
MSKDFLNVAVVGAGYWGKNLVRNFATAARCRLKYVCDLDEELLLRQKRNFPFIKTTTNLDEALADTEVDAVVVATEAQSHFEVAKGALEAGKSAYVEKPLTLKAGDSRALIELAKENGLKLMVGHLLLYHPGVNYVKKLIDSGQIGESYYMYTQRVNLGIVRQTENAWWS